MPPQRRNVLSIDFDYFFPLPRASAREHALYDWGHAESPFFTEAIWPIRAEVFRAYGLPLPTTSGEERDFWRHFAIAPGAPLYVSESHASLASREITDTLDWEGGVTVFNYDAHHDLGYGRDPQAVLLTGQFTCENWPYFYLGSYPPARYMLRYPAWRRGVPEPRWSMTLKPNGKSTGRTPGERAVIDAVFLCRSGAFVPSWCDDQFDAFLTACPTHADSATVFLAPLPRREFSAAAQRLVENVSAPLRPMEASCD